MLSKLISIARGNESFAEGHGTRAWYIRLRFINLKKHKDHFIVTYNNGPRHAKKHYCWVDYGGCIAPKEHETDSFKEAFVWVCRQLMRPGALALFQQSVPSILKRP